MIDPRLVEYAEFLVRDAVMIEPGDRILIEVHGDGMDLGKELVKASFKFGAHPYFKYYDYEMESILIRGSSEKHYRELAQRDLEMMKTMDAYIDIRGSKNIYHWNHLTPEEMKKYSEIYWGPIHLEERCNQTKWSVIRYPNDAMAQLSHMDTRSYEDYYFAACLYDYKKMEEDMKPLVEWMERTDQVRILGPQTDLTFSIKDIPVIPMHGNRNIPDGEVYTAPVRDSVNGVIRYNVASPYDGLVFQDVSFEFKDGKIIKANSNYSRRLNQILDTDEGARYIGEFAIGVHPLITKPIGDILFDEKMTGSFHLTPGNAYDNAFNGNRSAVHWDLIQLQTPEYGGGEIYFDDVLIRKDGLFVVEELKRLNP
ncbi:MAG: aminopeptidase [Tissierellia bacterium]|nr:aminopeptidase [Tissierellia bacterium]